MKNRNTFSASGLAATAQKPLSTGARKKQSSGQPLLHPQSKSAKISVPTFDGLQMLSTEDIVKCVAHESYTEIVLTCGSRYLVSRILKEYEHMLSGLNFFRIHHSCLINLRHVKKYIKGEGGYVLMSDGQCCEVSRRKKTSLIHRLSIVSL